MVHLVHLVSLACLCPLNRFKWSKAAPSKSDASIHPTIKKLPPIYPSKPPPSIPETSFPLSLLPSIYPPPPQHFLPLLPNRGRGGASVIIQLSTNPVGAS